VGKLGELLSVQYEVLKKRAFRQKENGEKGKKKRRTFRGGQAKPDNGLSNHSPESGPKSAQGGSMRLSKKHRLGRHTKGGRIG